MNKVLIVCCIAVSLYAKSRGLIDVHSYKNQGRSYNMLVEIPSGTNEKWEVSKKSGKLEIDLINGKKRIIQFKVVFDISCTIQD